MFLGTLSSAPRYLAALVRGNRPAVAAVFRAKNLVLAGAEPPTAALIASIDFALPGVIGPAALADGFVELWPSPARLGANQRIYQLREVIWPAAVRGGLRRARPGDEEVLFHWLRQFHHDAIPFESFDEEATRHDAAARVRADSTFLWEVEGEPVCMAALARPTERGICINAVYTPPDQRGRGYAASLVAAVSAEGLRRGKDFCMLYADLANPTSNRLYQRLGYQPVIDCRCYRFQ